MPVRLQLQNFLSYGEDLPPLDLTGVRMACLSGANGHGKSALLDAVTWALWGEARKAAGLGRAHGGLLRSSATEMWVLLDFDHEGHRYRVRRSWKASGRSGRMTLDLFAWDPARETYQVLTLESVTATERRIVSLLRMDHETFVNSAFLKQGRADEFTRRTPGDRKQVLSDILGLSRYARLRDEARADLAGVERDLTAADSAAATLVEELSRTSGAAEQLAEIEQRLACLTATLERAEQQAEELRQALHEDDQRAAKLQALGLELKRLEHDLTELRADAARGQAAIERREELVSRRHAIAQDAARLEDLDRQRATLEAALARRAELTSRRNRLEAELEGLEREARNDLRRGEEQIQELEAQRKEADEIVQGGDRLRQQAETLAAHRKRLAELDQQASQHRTLTDTIGALENRIERARGHLEVERDQLQKRFDEVRARANRGADLRRKLGEQRDSLSQVAAAAAGVEEEQARLSDLQAEFARLKEQYGRLGELRDEVVSHLAILAGGGGTCPVCNQELPESRRRSLETEYADQERDLVEQERDLKAEGRRLRDEQTRRERELARLRELAAKSADHERAIARLETELARCEQDEAELRSLEERLAELKRRLNDADYATEEQAELQDHRRRRDELDYQAAEHDRLRQAVDRGGSLERALARLEQAERRLADLAEQLPALREQTRQRRERLSGQEVGAEQRAALAALTAQLREVEADPADLARIDDERKRYADAPVALRQLEQAAAELPEAREAQAALAARIEQRAERQTAILAEQESLSDERLNRDELTRRQRELEQSVAASRAELDQVREQRGQAQEAVARATRQTQELAELRRRLGELTRQRTILGHLVTAFGKDGIPAMIIENAVPEIELAANEILTQLSDGRMHLTIRLQRQLQSGAERESLDLEISDELGTRSYENFSGGEAFRVNFALRLALSQLLARRAGARLRTLVIDEGFGTQDEEGIEQLVDAIHAVRDNFDLILAVTHLATLKDRFPTRIEVVKEPGLGSRYAVTGEGAGTTAAEELAAGSPAAAPTAPGAG